MKCIWDLRLYPFLSPIKLDNIRNENLKTEPLTFQRTRLQTASLFRMTSDRLGNFI